MYAFTPLNEVWASIYQSRFLPARSESFFLSLDTVLYFEEAEKRIVFVLLENKSIYRLH